MKPTLLVLDPQNDFFEADNPNLAEFLRAVLTINTAIALFRERGWPIVVIQHTSKKKPAGSHAWGVYPGFDCRPEDHRVQKSHLNAFWDSELNTILKLAGVDFVIVAGYISEMCVLSTFRGACERGYQSAILKDAIASFDNQRTQLTLDICTSISLDELRQRDPCANKRR